MEALRTSNRPAGRPAPEKSPDTVSALDRGLALLNCFGSGHRRLGASELSRMTGIPRPTVIRLAASLVTQRWLRLEESSESYALGAGVLSLGRNFLLGLDWRGIARKHMQGLADACGATCLMGTLDDAEMVVVEACYARNLMLAPRMDVGTRLPLDSSALGRGYLVALDEAQRRALGVDARSALAQFNQQGWVMSAGEFHREIHAVAIALRDAQGAVWVINCGGNSLMFDVQRLTHEVAPALLAMARALAEETGGELVQPTL